MMSFPAMWIKACPEAAASCLGKYRKASNSFGTTEKRESCPAPFRLGLVRLV
jgi:hypothetical protein